MRPLLLFCSFLSFLSCSNPKKVDLLLLNGTVYDDSGSEPLVQDIGITGELITFVGNSKTASIEAQETIDVTGLMVTPGFIDMHSHVVVDKDYGRDALPFLYQGITTAVIGVDGGGTPEISNKFDGLVENGTGINVLAYVGHGAIRRRVLGLDNRAPSPDELQEMKKLIKQGMEQGAIGFSTGLFYTPGFFSKTEEVIELAKIAAKYDGIYDTHDRDLGASYQGIGYLNSIRERLYADIAVFDREKIRDLATFENPHQYSEGTVHVIVNGKLALKNGKDQDVLAGLPIVREGKIYQVSN